MTPYEAYYYQDEAGAEPVRDYIQSLSVSERAKTYAFIKHLSQHGPRTLRPAADYLGGRTGLYELRPKPHRYIYFFYQRNRIILLHAFEKDTDAIRERDLKLSLARKDDFIHRRRISKVEFEGKDHEA